MHHTPGPWRVYDATSITPYVGTIPSNPEKGWDHQTVCTLFEDKADNYDTHNDFVPFSNAEVNARLIAAAPDLLAFAKRIASLPHHGEYVQLINEARAAINKATGE